MDIQKILLKIAYWLVALSIVVLIGFTLYARHILSGQSQESQNISVRKTETTEEGTNVQFSGMSVTIDNKKARKEIAELKAAMQKDEEDRAGE